MMLIILLSVVLFLLLLLIFGRPKKEEVKEKKKCPERGRGGKILQGIFSFLVGFFLLVAGGILAALFGGK